jgi:hypothetical protein
MKNLLALLATAVIAFFGLGWYLDWYRFSTAPGEAPGRRSVTIDVDTQKIGKDLKNGSNKLQSALENATRDDQEAGTTPPVNKAAR